MARKPQQYGDTVYKSQTSGGGGWGSSILNPSNEDNILRLFNPKREDNILRRFNPTRDDNIVRSLLGMNTPRAAPAVTAGSGGPARAIRQTPRNRGSLSRSTGGYGRNYMPDPSAREGNEGPPGGFQFDGNGMPTMEDLLSQVQGMFSEQSGGIANRKAQMEANRRAALASMGSATDALAQQLAASRGEVDQRFTQGINEAATANQDARNTLAQQQATSLGQNAELYKNLGISVDESRSADDLAYGQGTLAELGGARDTEQRGRQLTSYELGSRNMDAARMRGVENQAGYERDYQGMLAELLDEEQQLKAQSQSQVGDLYSQARDTYTDERDFAYKQWLNENEWAREDAKNALDYEMQQSRQEPAELNPQDALLEQLRGYGVTPGKSQQWMDRLYGNLGTIKNNPQEFSSLFQSASAPAKAALYNYLLQTGAIGKG